MGKQGLLKGVKMKHISGSLICTNPPLKSRWVCNYAGSSSNVATEITDNNKNVLLPDLKVPRDRNHRFIIKGHDGETADWMTFVDLTTPTYVEKGTRSGLARIFEIYGKVTIKEDIVLMST